MNQKFVDIVAPIYNGLTYVKDCVNSILRETPSHDYNFYLIDDCSDRLTQNFLQQIALDYPQIYLHRNEQNLGFLKSCNLGMSLGKAPYLVIVNSDVIVSPNWLHRLIECAESDPTIATVNPLTNHASNVNIPIPPGANFYGMDRLLAQISLCNHPDVVTGVGFCMLLRRSALEDVGLFDEIYDHGYCEESDLCMRLTTKGYRTVVADNVYVYHKGKVSFKESGVSRYQKNRLIFDDRWSEEYQRQFNQFIRANPLKKVRDLFKVPQQQWDPIGSMRETYHTMKYLKRKGQWLPLAKTAIKGVLKLPRASRDIPTPEFVAKVTRPKRLRVTYLLPGLGISGGMLSVVQLANELILLGIEARIVTLSIQKQEVSQWKFLSEPIVLRTREELLENFPESDLAVATFWTTAPWVRELVQAGRAKVGAYFLQDYESWFYPESDRHTREKVKATYDLIDSKIVKSDWLQELLAGDGYQTHKITLGMDLSTFYQRDTSKSDRPKVIAMARPTTPRRGFIHVIEALRLLQEAIPETEIILFGDENLKNHHIPFEFKNLGIVSDQDRLAQFYSSADIFLDGSNFQGFGRPALEAMACGAACVLTNVGGVKEYAIHRENCLLVPPKQPEAFAEAMAEILTNKSLKQSLVENGLKTVQNYCHKREARETLSYFQQLL